MPSPISRAKFAGTLAAAFLGGLIVASGFDLTGFGYAQQSRPVSTVAGAPPSSSTASVAELNVAFTSIAERVTPAVVSVHSARSQTPQEQRNQRPNRQQQLEDFFDQFDPRRQQPREASGSGFVVTADGYILTNNHVVAGFDRVEVTLTDHRTYPARVVGRDADTDVAVLKIDARNLQSASLGDDAAVKIGEWVLAIGNPLGLDFTVTAGIVSAKGRSRVDVPVNRNNWAITDFIQTDAAINPGNSGGPLVNIRGEVIGINTAIASQTGFYSGYGFAIPITLARDVMDDIITHGRVRRAVLGVSIIDAQPEDAGVAGAPDVRGVLVQGYSSDDSPARRAGLQQGDLIVKADGKDADRVSTLQRIVRSHEPGDVIAVEAWRYGQKKTFQVRLAEAPDSATRVAADTRSNPPPAEGAANEKLGITVEPISDEAARANRLPENYRGLRVVDADPNGPARGGRLGEGDILVEVLNPGLRRPLRTAADLQQVLSRVDRGGYVSLLVYNVEAQNTRVVNLRVGPQ
jgi:serine protease Do